MSCCNGQIVSASRRTDIPAFYGDWLYRQVQQGFVDVPNPFSNKTYRVSLQADDVGAFVFWSKNYEPFIPVLKKIEPVYNSRFLFHFTINGYENRAKQLFEPNTPDSLRAIENATYLAERYGKKSVLWRFDPIIFSSVSPVDERIAAFENLAAKLKGSVSRCYISFVDLYGKVRRRFEKIEHAEDIRFYRPRLTEQAEMVRKLAGIASKQGITIFTCCEDDIAAAAGISSGHCIDAQLLQQLYPEIQFTGQLKPTRAGCGCYASRDIGSYNSCRHHCLYCYANK